MRYLLGLIRRLPISVYFMMWFVPVFVLGKDFLKPQEFLRVFSEAATYKIIWFSIYQGLLSVAFSLIIALPAAYYYSRKSGIIKNILGAMIFIPFFFPPVSAIISFSLVFGKSGLFGTLGLDIPVLYTLQGIVLAHGFYNSSIFVKYIGDALATVPNHILENSRIDGCGRLNCFIKIELPMVWAAVMKGAFLVFVYSFTSFIIILSIGGIHFTNLETAIATTLRSNLDFSMAAAYFIVQFAVIILLQIVVSRFKGYTMANENKNEEISKIVLALTLLYLLFQGIIAAAGIIFSLINVFNGRDFVVKRLFSKEFSDVYNITGALINTIVVSLAASLITTIFAFIILKLKKRFSDIIIMATMGISSAFIAVAAYYTNLALNFPPVFVMIMLYVVITVPIAYSFLIYYVSSFDKTFVEMAANDGAGILKTFLKVELPLLFPYFVSVFMQVTAVIIGEFTIAYTMNPGDEFPLLSTVIFSMYSSHLRNEAVLISAIMLIIVFAIYTAVEELKSRYKTE